MRELYLDNGATAFPKAPGVAESMYNYLTKIGCNVNRGAYKSSFEAENIVYETRELICELFNFNKTENVIFTKNVTESLNILVKGLLKPGDHVIISSMEHNAVVRPINSLVERGVEYSKVMCNREGELDPNDIYGLIKPNTKAIVMTHASNVCGTILDLKRVGSMCKERGLYFIMDTAQTAGFLDIDYKELNADAIAFTGHKGLLGPQGIGGFIVNDELATVLDTLVEGGTGSLSDKEVQPEYMPDKFEAGTLNIPGIYGLNAALKYILKEKVNTIKEKELFLLENFLEGILNIPELNIVGKKNLINRTAVVSIDIPTKDNAIIAYNLYNDFGIMTRCGLHCAPSAHQTLGTFPQGTIRFSFSYFNTIEDVKYAIDAIYKVIRS
ncbi:aminotransferase class V-fold PLP-dependent enzyme [Tepidimicrobium xylanilyticum]|uniref:aminotransferase class V-fold PLP-dependent enzyme n=1 Tax=Tepidimicrobium xylanilyticum TaxID=1123352 RepID=UPI00265654C4|nr:aminotransferase class V-fold PLP-dependent enzyme [Tepidimicrobium xylanilyticum]GMG95901.1 cysteine desulfurase [Tepidimicrobium xylanilyticum]